MSKDEDTSAHAQHWRSGLKDVKSQSSVSTDEIRKTFTTNPKPFSTKPSTRVEPKQEGYKLSQYFPTKFGHPYTHKRNDPTESLKKLFSKIKRQDDWLSQAKHRLDIIRRVYYDEVSNITPDIRKAVLERDGYPPGYLDLRPDGLSPGLSTEDIIAVSYFVKHCDEIRYINLSSNQISDAGTTVLAEGLKHCTNLKSLDLHYNKISDAGTMALAQGLKHCTNLKSLDLHYNKISDAGTMALAEGLKYCNNLESLDLSSNQISDAGTTALAQGLKYCTHLKNLDLSSNQISGVGATTLAEVLDHCKLKRLVLSSNPISDTGVAALVQGLRHCSRIEYLKLRRNQITHKGAEALAEALLEVKYLYLDENNISDSGVAALALALEKCSKIILIGLDRNNISDRGAITLAKSLRNSSYISTLCLRDNNITDAGALALSTSLEQCLQLRFLHLDGNNITDVGAVALAKCSENCKHLKLYPWNNYKLVSWYDNKKKAEGPGFAFFRMTHKNWMTETIMTKDESLQFIGVLMKQPLEGTFRTWGVNLTDGIRYEDNQKTKEPVKKVVQNHGDTWRVEMTLNIWFYIYHNDEIFCDFQLTVLPGTETEIWAAVKIGQSEISILNVEDNPLVRLLQHPKAWQGREMFQIQREECEVQMDQTLQGLVRELGKNLGLRKMPGNYPGHVSYIITTFLYQSEYRVSDDGLEMTLVKQDTNVDFLASLMSTIKESHGDKVQNIHIDQHRLAALWSLQTNSKQNYFEIDISLCFEILTPPNLVQTLDKKYPSYARYLRSKLTAMYLYDRRGQHRLWDGYMEQDIWLGLQKHIPDKHVIFQAFLSLISHTLPKTATYDEQSQNFVVSEIVQTDPIRWVFFHEVTQTLNSDCWSSANIKFRYINMLKSIQGQILSRIPFIPRFLDCAINHLESCVCLDVDSLLTCECNTIYDIKQYLLKDDEEFVLKNGSLQDICRKDKAGNIYPGTPESLPCSGVIYKIWRSIVSDLLKVRLSDIQDISMKMKTFCPKVSDVNVVNNLEEQDSKYTSLKSKNMSAVLSMSVLSRHLDSDTRVLSYYFDVQDNIRSQNIEIQCHICPVEDFIEGKYSTDEPPPKSLSCQEVFLDSEMLSTLSKYLPQDQEVDIKSKIEASCLVFFIKWKCQENHEHQEKVMIPFLTNFKSNPYPREKMKSQIDFGSMQNNLDSATYKVVRKKMFLYDNQRENYIMKQISRSNFAVAKYYLRIFTFLLDSVLPQYLYEEPLATSGFLLSPIISEEILVTLFLKEFTTAPSPSKWSLRHITNRFINMSSVFLSYEPHIPLSGWPDICSTFSNNHLGNIPDRRLMADPSVIENIQCLIDFINNKALPVECNTGNDDKRYFLKEFEGLLEVKSLSADICKHFPKYVYTFHGQNPLLTNPEFSKYVRKAGRGEGGSGSGGNQDAGGASEGHDNVGDASRSPSGYNNNNNLPDEGGDKDKPSNQSSKEELIFYKQLILCPWEVVSKDKCKYTGDPGDVVSRVAAVAHVPSKGENVREFERKLWAFLNVILFRASMQDNAPGFLKENTENKTFDLISIGSFACNAKVLELDEFDYHCVINLPEAEIDFSKAGGDLYKFDGYNQEWEMNQSFLSAVTCTEGDRCLDKFYVCTSGPATTLCFRWKCDKGHPHSLDVDVSLAIRVYDSKVKSSFKIDQTINTNGMPGAYVAFGTRWKRTFAEYDVTLFQHPIVRDTLDVYLFLKTVSYFMSPVTIIKKQTLCKGQRESMIVSKCLLDSNQVKCAYLSFVKDKGQIYRANFKDSAYSILDILFSPSPQGFWPHVTDIHTGTLHGCGAVDALKLLLQFALQKVKSHLNGESDAGKSPLAPIDVQYKPPFYILIEPSVEKNCFTLDELANDGTKGILDDTYWCKATKLSDFHNEDVSVVFLSSCLLPSLKNHQVC